MENDKLEDWEDKFYQMSVGVAGIYHLYHTYLLAGHKEKAINLIPNLRGFMRDMKGWLLKHEYLSEINEKDIWQE